MKMIHYCTGKRLFFLHSAFYVIFISFQTFPKPTQDPLCELCWKLHLGRSPGGTGPPCSGGLRLMWRCGGTGADQLDRGESRDAKRKDKMYSKSMHLGPAL